MKYTIIDFRKTLSDFSIISFVFIISYYVHYEAYLKMILKKHVY